MDFHLSGKGVFTPVKLSLLVADLVAAKTASKKSPDYVKSLRQYLSLFAKAHADTPVQQINAEHIQAWFAGRNEAANTMRSNLGRLSALFSFAIRKGLIYDNPVKRIEAPAEENRPPDILTPHQSHLIARYARRYIPRFSAVLALCLFCGLRPSEARRIQWHDVNKARRVVTVRVSKTRRWRVASIPECALPYLTGDLPMGLTAYRRCFRRLSDMTHIKLGQDALRHTAASYWLALNGDATKTATQLGNSPKILLTHYNGLASNTDAQRFFKL